MILVIDNYDSFVHNLARYAELSGGQTHVVRNDQIDIESVRSLNPKSIILSPGPCTPDEAGICIPLIQEFGSRIPILGVCLGHQAIGQAYGGETIRAERPLHGQATSIHHEGKGLFKNLPSPMEVGRYHSLITDIDLSDNLKITAQTDAGTIMAISHKTHPVYGVQFHPESILTPHGLDIMANFFALADAFHTSDNKEAA